MPLFPWRRNSGSKPSKPLSPNQRFVTEQQGRINKAHRQSQGQDDEGGLIKSLFTRANLKTETTKPLYDIWYVGQGPRVQLPRFMISYWELFELAYSNPTVRLCVEQIAKEAFRNGGEWRPKWKRRCFTCKRIFEHVPHINWFDTQVEGCETCKVPGTLAQPNPEEVEYARWLFEHANNQESAEVSAENIMDLFYQMSWDIDVVDNGWLLIVKDYYWDEEEKKIFAHPKELVRGHPLVMRIVSDDRGVRGGKYLSCPLHRDYVVELVDAQYAAPSFGGLESNLQSTASNPRILKDKEDPPKFCPECAKESRYNELKQVWYVATEMGGERPTGFYFADEVLHVKKHARGLFYGVPPLLTLYRVTRSLIKMEEYIHEYFERRRIPRGVVMVRRQAALPGLSVAPNEMEVDAFKDDMNRRAQDDPHDIPFVAVSGDDVQFLPFADTIREMDLVSLRQEFRSIIGAYYGVSPVFQGDMSAGGGLNNEGLQITVTNRAVEDHQRIFNEKVIPFILTQLGVENWEYVLNPSEEKDEAHEWDLKLKADQHAMNRKNMGFQVWINDFDEYEFSQEAIDTQEVPAEGGAPPTGSAHPGMGEDEMTAEIESPGGADSDSQRFQGEPDLPLKGQQSNLVPYRGPKGGQGSINPDTGRVYYGLANKAESPLAKAAIKRMKKWR